MHLVYLSTLLGLAAVPSLAAPASSADLAKRQQDRTNFSFRRAAGGVIGYSWWQGNAQLWDVRMTCFGHRQGTDKKEDDCFYNAMQMSLGYTLFTLVVATDNPAVTALMQGFTAFGNWQSPPAFDGPTTRQLKPKEELGPLPEYYDRLYDSIAAEMNNTQEENQLQQCSGHHPMYSPHEWFRWPRHNGIKTQCVGGCDDRHIDWNAIEGYADNVASELIRTGNLNAQYTIFNSANRVVARCMSTVQTNPANVCPEHVTGSGCFVSPW
ncbi:hypothetical protein BDZ85DRAFT_254123 [Elsinoe ampelina]|uniref:Uncharacterized protein n=1 Tax=Elsinoe ampelina TaxID=302913 RepID=A0A6A6GNV9_9PEZI|nr:hypothetical protein BDZ85DRAFT_254123 [Elsinoe ampelina]